LKITGVSPNPGVLLTSDHLFFGQVNYGNTGVSQTVTIVNHSSSPLHLASIADDGSGTDPMSASQNCLGTVAVDASCRITVTFKPTQGGSRTGTLSIADDGPGSPHVVTLAGTSIGPGLSLSPMSLTFGSQTSGTTSAVQTITLNNTGTAALTIASIATSGDFAQTNTCGTSVVAGATCTVAVTFTPAATGSRAGTLTISDNVTGSPQTVALTLPRQILAVRV
jgi:hypothetical protein